MKRFFLMAAAIVCANFAGMSAQAGNVPLPTLLSSLTPAGDYTTVGPLEFSNFSYLSASVPSSSIVVGSFTPPDAPPGDLGLTFSSESFVSAPGASLGGSIFYTVTSSAGPITDAYLSVTGSSPTSDPGTNWSVDETIKNAATGQVIGVLSASEYGSTSQTITFAGVQSITVEKDILIGGSFTTAPSNISIVDQGYSSFSAVPEPASMALLGIGLTGLLAYRRRFKKASV